MKKFAFIRQREVVITLEETLTVEVEDGQTQADALLLIQNPAEDDMEVENEGTATLFEAERQLAPLESYSLNGSPSITIKDGEGNELWHNGVNS